jgi:hypothetical protein
MRIDKRISSNGIAANTLKKQLLLTKKYQKPVALTGWWLSGIDCN